MMANEPDMQSIPGLGSIEEHTLIMSHVHRLQSSYRLTVQSTEISEERTVQKTIYDLSTSQQEQIELTAAAGETSSTDIRNILTSLRSDDDQLTATTLDGLVIDEEQLVSTQPDNSPDTRVENDLQLQDSTVDDSECGQVEVESEQTQLTSDKIETTTIIQREKDAEHELIHHYTSKMMRNSDNNMEDQNVDVNNCQDKTSDSVQQQQQLLVLRTGILELRRKIAEVKEIQRLQKDIRELEQNITAQQEKRTNLTTSRDELMKSLKARNSLWRSPTMSQAASELSIDQQLLTPTSADYEFFNDTELCDNMLEHKQIEQLQQKLEQMVRGCNTESDVVTVPTSQDSDGQTVDEILRV